jgi:hypothetical protein
MRVLWKSPASYAPPERVAAPEACVTCGREITTKYCPDCGEMRASERSHSVVAFMREHVLEAMLSLDGRVIRTLKTLLLKPGELTAAFMRGSRTPYLAPLQCFLLFNIVFFLTNSGVLDMPLGQQIRGTGWRHTAQRLVSERLLARHIDYNEFAAQFDAVNSAQARSLVIVMVPVFALVVGLLMIPRRRPIVQHLVFSLHTYSFFFIGLPIALLLVAWPAYHILRAVVGPTSDDGVYTIVAMLSLFIYLTLSLRRAYSLSWVYAIVAGAVGMFGVAQIMVSYRHMLLYVTLRAM